MVQSNITELVTNYAEAGDTHTHRYRSFDHCYTYFRRTKDLTGDMEKSCFVLGFYLASWGMFRGSSKMLQTNAKRLQPVVEYIANQSPDLWAIDVGEYDEANLKRLVKVYDGIKEALALGNSTHITLVTKIMLGVFGFVPAYDTNFCRTFRELAKERCGFRSFNPKSLLVIKEFYDANRVTIDALSQQYKTVDFVSNQPTDICYPKAKIIDMFGFQALQKG